jgi:hypothetical protein
MEPFIGFALIAGLVMIRHYAARQIARGQGRFVWIYIAPMTLAMIVVVWIAIRMWTTQPLAAIGLGLVSVLTLLLFLRSASQSALDVDAGVTTGELSASYFDYVVWVAVLAPVLLAVLLLLLLVTGGLSTSR